MSSAAVCRTTPLREVKSTIATACSTQLSKCPSRTRGPTSRCRATARSARRPAGAGRQLVAGVADAVREDEMRAIGDGRQQPAEHMLGDVVAVRVPEDQHPRRVADDRVEVGRGDVLFARLEVRQPRRRHEAARRGRVSVRQRGERHRLTTRASSACAAVVNTHVELPRCRPSSTISVGAKSSVAANSWPHWNNARSSRPRPPRPGDAAAPTRPRLRRADPNRRAPR